MSESESERQKMHDIPQHTSQYLQELQEFVDVEREAIEQSAKLGEPTRSKLKQPTRFDKQTPKSHEKCEDIQMSE